MVGLELAPVGSEPDGLPLHHGELKWLHLYFNIKRSELVATQLRVVQLKMNKLVVEPRFELQHSTIYEFNHVYLLWK